MKGGRLRAWLRRHREPHIIRTASGGVLTVPRGVVNERQLTELRLALGERVFEDVPRA